MRSARWSAAPTRPAPRSSAARSSASTARKTWSPSWVDDVHLVKRAAASRSRSSCRCCATSTPGTSSTAATSSTAQGLWFREGVAYEDQPIVTQLFARARSIDVLPDIVYRYRARDDQSSISQQTATLKDLRRPDRGLGGQPRRASAPSSAARLRRLAPDAVRGALPVVPHQPRHRRRRLLERAGRGDPRASPRARRVGLGRHAARPAGAGPAGPARPPGRRPGVRPPRRQQARPVAGARSARTASCSSCPCSATPSSTSPCSCSGREQVQICARGGERALGGPIRRRPAAAGSRAGPSCARSTWPSTTDRDRPARAPEHRGGRGLPVDRAARRASFPPPRDDLWCDYAPGRFGVERAARRARRPAARRRRAGGLAAGRGRRPRRRAAGDPADAQRRRRRDPGNPARRRRPAGRRLAVPAAAPAPRRPRRGRRLPTSPSTGGPSPDRRRRRRRAGSPG